MMKDIDIAKLKELAEQATPGKWQVDADARHIRIVTADDACVYPFWLTPTPNKEANAAYIAAFSPDIALALIAEIERLNFVAWHIARIAAMYECQSDDEAELDKTMCNLFKVAEFSVSKGASWKQRNTTSRP